MRNNRLPKILAIGCAGSLMMAGAGLLPASAASTSESASFTSEELSASFTSEELLDGIVFSSGPAAKQMGTERILSDALTPEQSDILQETTEVLRSSILTTDRDVLETAGGLVTSGDVYAVEKGLTLYSGMYLDALKKQYPEASLDSAKKSASAGTEPNCVVGPALAVAAAAVIFVGIYNIAGHANAVYQNGVYWESNAYTGKSANSPGLLLPSPTENGDEMEAASSMSLGQTESVKLVTKSLSSDG